MMILIQVVDSGLVIIIEAVSRNFPLNLKSYVDLDVIRLSCIRLVAVKHPAFALRCNSDISRDKPEDCL